jgi:hypothetical protein
MTSADGLAVIALAVSALGLVVSVISVVIAWGAKRQANKAAMLVSRREAINHIDQAHFDVTNNGYVTDKTVNHIQEARKLAALVFNRKLRTELEQVRATAAALNVPDVRERIEKANSGDNVKLGNDLQTLITRMNEETALGGRWRERWAWLRSTG